jgi:hypothetical protein
MSHCAGCELVAIFKCSICLDNFCEVHAKAHLKFWDNSNTKMIKLEPTDAKTL